MFYLIPYKGRVPIYPVSSPNGTRLQQGSCLYTCPLDVRYMSGIEADKYRTYTGQVPDNNGRNMKATQGLSYG